MKIPVLIFLIGTPAMADTEIIPNSVGLTILNSTSPIPQYCTPRWSEFNVFVASQVGIVKILDSASLRNGEYFDVNGYFLSDSNNDGQYEPFAFGVLRSSVGGTFPSYMWPDEIGTPIDIRKGSYSDAYNIGIRIDNIYGEDNNATPIINMAEWKCISAVNDAGNTVVSN